MISFLLWGIDSTTPKPQAGGPPPFGSQWPLIQYIRSNPPYWMGFCQLQLEDAPCCGDRDPLIMACPDCGLFSQRKPKLTALYTELHVRARGIQKYMLMFQCLKALWNFFSTVYRVTQKDFYARPYTSMWADVARQISKRYSGSCHVLAAREVL